MTPSRMAAPTPRLTQRTFREILARRPDPLDVLKSTARVVAHPRHVTIDRLRVETVAQILALREAPVPTWNYTYHYFDGTAHTLTYLFLLDALNFSFWGEPKWTITYRGTRLDGYWALAAALKRAVEANRDVLATDYLAEISPQDLAHILRGRNEIPMFVERWRNVQELGRVLRDRFGGRAARVVEEAKRDAPQPARLVTDHFTSFHDTSIYNSRAVNFFKRAQILVADLWGSFGGQGLGEFDNLVELTAFADYKLPQLLRAWGILQYDARLARRVNQRFELPKDSAEEIEIRAATLWGVELLREALARRGRVLTSVQVDWFLWETSQHQVAGMKPYHRVRTCFY
jgi:Queuosine salvage protein